MKAVGMKKYKVLTNQELKEASNDFLIPIEKSFYFDSLYYNYLDSLKRESPEIAKNHYQPLQALYFNSDKQLVGFMVNCYAPGFPNLHWNKFGSFNSFPPSDTAKIIDRIFTLNSLARFAKSIDSIGQEKLLNVNSADYYVVLVWTRFMGRQTKRLFNEVEKNIKLSENKSVSILYINADNIFMSE